MYKKKKSCLFRNSFLRGRDELAADGDPDQLTVSAGPSTVLRVSGQRVEQWRQLHPQRNELQRTSRQCEFFCVGAAASHWDSQRTSKKFKALVSHAKKKCPVYHTVFNNTTLCTSGLLIRVLNYCSFFFFFLSFLKSYVPLLAFYNALKKQNDIITCYIRLPPGGAFAQSKNETAGKMKL